MSEKTVTTDKTEDRAYRNGYLQAWREWSDCVTFCRTASGFQDQYLIGESDMKKLEKRKSSIEKRVDSSLQEDSNNELENQFEQQRKKQHNETY